MPNRKVTPDPREPPEAVLQFDAEMITLVVGPDRERFLLHRSHAQYSGFLRAAFKDEWMQGARKLELPDDDADEIRRYLHFLYTGKIASKVSGADEALHAQHQAESIRLCRLYVLGEKYQDPKLKNAVVDAIIGKLHDEDEEGWGPTGIDVDIIYRGTCEGSPARKLMIDLHMESGWAGWITNQQVQNPEFLKDLCAKMLQQRHDERRDYYGYRNGENLPANTEYHEEVGKA